MYKKLTNKVRAKTIKVLQTNQKKRGAVYFFRKSLSGTELLRPFSQVIKKVVGLGVSCSTSFTESLGFRFASSLLLYKKGKIQTLCSVVEEYVRKQRMLFQSSLTRHVSSSLSFKIKNGFVSGLRYSQGLPCRGQRTKTNARSNKNRRSGAIK